MAYKSMAEFWYTMVKNSEITGKTIDDAPEKWREEVERMLEEDDPEDS